tara:strand:+ start:365 stop:835 length:471 start_codon:yes stop_codon:yes gene_type:complete
MESNPYNLKVLDEKPSGYLSAQELVDFLKKNKIPVKRMDNLPRFAHQNKIEMKKILRDGSGGSVPTIYKIPSSAQILKIAESMKNNNNSELGKQLLKKKKEKILEIFDKAEDRKETRTSIADKVSKSLGVNCNRKLVRAVLDAKRSSRLEKLKKIS